MTERTVSGNRVVITRLDEEGKPTGEPMVMDNATFDLDLGDEDEPLTTWSGEVAYTEPITISFKSSPDLFRLLFGLTKWQWRRLRVAGWVARKIAGKVVHRG